MPEQIRYELIDETWVDRLALFFEMIRTRGEDRYFHPHLFTEEKAIELGHYSGLDIYLVQTMGKTICGYGMLRGWDEGYDVPSLGIIIHPDYRGRGLGEKLMLFLHDQARQKGVEKIRLKVYPQNSGAMHLYQKLGYSFLEKSNEQRIGFLAI